jgi:hypothetical protein
LRFRKTPLSEASLILGQSLAYIFVAMFSIFKNFGAAMSITQAALVYMFLPVFTIIALCARFWTNRSTSLRLCFDLAAIVAILVLAVTMFGTSSKALGILYVGFLFSGSMAALVTQYWFFGTPNNRRK